MVVAEVHQGRGIGTQALVQYVNESGAEEVYLDVRIDNVRAIRAYKRSGFRILRRYPPLGVGTWEMVWKRTVHV
jgi:ribosomal protein S18 acetylase RimI-like enzyme